MSSHLAMNVAMVRNEQSDQDWPRSGALRDSFFICSELSGRCIGINDLMINEEIRDREVRVVDQNGAQLGVMPVKQALDMA